MELFVDPEIKFPKLRVANRLLKKKLGMRMLMDVTPLDATLVKGSHGRIPEDENEWPIFIGPGGQGEAPAIEDTDVYGKLMELIQG